MSIQSDKRYVDIIFRNAIVEGVKRPADVAVAAGLIEAIGPHLLIESEQEYDVSGMMVSPLFIDPHHHLDCAYLSDRMNRSGTLHEAISINAALKPTRSPQEVFSRACRALEQALLHGTGWIRSHVDIDPESGLKFLHPVLEAIRFG